MAMIVGNVNLLDLVAHQSPDFQSIITNYDHDAFRKAVSYGNLNVLQYLDRKAPELLRNMHRLAAENLIFDAIRHGNLDVLSIY